MFRGRSLRASDLLPGAAAALVLVAALWPPEMHAWSQAACQGLLAVLVLAAALGGEAAVALRPPAWFALLAVCGLAPVLAAAGRARAVDEAAYATLLVGAGLAGRALAARPRGPNLAGAILAILGVTAAGHAAVQRFFTYPALATALRSTDPADPTGVLVRLEAGRPSGPFLLPAALGGFLALSLPWVCLMAARGREPRVRALAACAAVALCGGLVLTRSLGGLVAAGAGMLVLLPLIQPRRRRRLAAGAIALVLILGAAWFAARRPDLRPAAGAGSFTLRAGNWGAATRMVLDHPVLGTGPGSFASFYPRYMRPGMNESRHAHNSYLEVMAGWGLWSIGPLGLLVAAWARAVAMLLRRLRADRRGGRSRGDAEARLALLAGGGAFLAHNLGDFTAFLPGVAIPAALLLGCGIGWEGGEPRSGDAASRGSGRGAGPRLPVARRAAAVLLGVLLAAHGLVAARSRTLLLAARQAAEGGDIEGAFVLGERARDARPGDPDPRAFLAQGILAHPGAGPARRAQGEREAAEAVRLDPEAAVLHWTGALYHLAAGRPAAAWRERAAARRLYPLKDLYRPPAAAASPARGSGP